MGGRQTRPLSRSLHPQHHAHPDPGRHQVRRRIASGHAPGQVHRLPQSLIPFRRPPGRADFRHYQQLPDLAIRSGKWKLLCDYDGGNPRLHDPCKDCGEKTNLAAKEPERFKALAAMVLAWHKSMPPDNGPQMENAGAKWNQGRSNPLSTPLGSASPSGPPPALCLADSGRTWGSGSYRSSLRKLRAAWRPLQCFAKSA